MKTYLVELNNGLVIKMAWGALIMWLSARCVTRFQEIPNGSAQNAV